MKYLEMFKLIENLEFDKKKIILTDKENVQVFIIRPSVMPTSLRNTYDLKKNFQIWLKESDREFKPNHLRLMLDLNLRTRSRPELKEKLLTIFDNVFYGEDPDKEVKSLENEEFKHYLNTLRVIANLSQLFLIEQELNYTRKSNFDPKNLFFQGWIREFIDSPKEIDNMCMSVCRFQPPKVQYTCKENKKNRQYNSNLEPLWYLE